jgi:polyphenol oxidase
MPAVMTFLDSPVIDRQSSTAWSRYHLPEIEQAGIVHGFMTRSSDGIIINPAERRRFVQALGASDSIIMQQEHGDEVHVVQNGERPAVGDGLLLIEKRVVGVIKTADCLPVILYDPAVPMAAIVHAGWRGTVRRITEKALRHMVALGAKPERMGAIIGPGIGPCCYQVGVEVVADFQRSGFGEHLFTERGGGLFLDLKRANRDMVEAEGIARIDDVGLCTSCRQDLFFSARNDKKAGRLVNFVVLKR